MFSSGSFYLHFSPNNVSWASQVAPVVKNPPAKKEMWVRSLGGEDTLEKEIVNHSSILAWEIPWTNEPEGLQFMGLQESDVI